VKKHFILLTALLLAPFGLHAAELAVVARHKAVFTKPPENIPSRMHQHDAPILGNGDLTVAFAGEPEFPQFWIAANDFFGGPRAGSRRRAEGARPADFRGTRENPGFSDACLHRDAIGFRCVRKADAT